MRGLLIASLLVASCSSNSGSLVLVTVDSSMPIPDVTRLHASVTVGTKTQEHDLTLATPSIPPTHTFAIQVSPGVSGTLMLHLEGFSSTGTSVGTADASVALAAAGARVDLPILFGGAPSDGGMNDLPGGGCVTSADCADATPICESGMCRACAGAADDAECVVHSPTKPLCDATSGACRACAQHTECASQVCKTDGSCAPMGMVAYVNNGGMTVAACKTNGMTHDGTTAATAFCDAQDGVMSGKPYVAVRGSAQPYGAVTVSANNITIVGPGVVASPTAILTGLNFGGSGTGLFDGLDASAEVQCSGAGTAMFIYKNGRVQSTPSGPCIDVGICNANIDNNILNNCFAGGITLGSGTSTVHANHISMNRVVATDTWSGYGIRQESAGNITIDGNEIGPGNASGGVVINAGSWTFINNVVHDNVSLAGYFNSPGGTFQFNTIANHADHGIECNGGQIDLYDSIIWRNPAGMYQYNGNCVRHNIVVDAAQTAGAGEVALDPAFTNPSFDFSLIKNNAANTACCVDKIPSTTTGLPDHDFASAHRPLGNGFDIGAFEVQ